MREKITAYRLFVRKPEGKRLLGRPRRKWVDNIKTDLLEIGWGGLDKCKVLVNVVMNLLVP
jgi:hypothetical protein